jgi:dihydrofolate synthase/folylpolyglutamate synthase
MASTVTYENVLKYMNSLEFAGMKLGRERILAALKRYGNPEKNLKIVHVAGTNGKGSVAAMVSAMLQKAGRKVGLFTSPHLVDVRERIRVNSRMISKEDFRDAFLQAKEEGPDLPFFELVTLMAVLYFAKQKVDYAVFEVGLGGTHDATNFEESLISVITRISLDHTDILGESLDKIAWEKCNIIKNGQTVVTTLGNKEVMKVIRNSAQEKGASLVVVGKPDFDVALKGRFQKENAGVAVEVARQLGVGDEDIKNALLEVEWPGRIEWLSKNVLMDCAHNPAGMNALRKYVEALEYKKLIIVFAVSKNKNYKEMLELLPSHDELVFTQTSVTRRLQIEEVPKDVPCTKIREPMKALAYAKSKATEKDLVLVCGSIFLVADIKAAFDKVSGSIEEPVVDREPFAELKNI